ncbi:nucleotide exchange factor GrpE [uncultured Dokdonia sp.]|uniref:nucleotide exchange factor GrpE n=1 Tax=uncultured Dokdonia sp. TaxID=575653 RepID=UPI002621AC4F|nr:nucleotide exchange factor GrpE [uncultured Dokdonia sp.]
MANKENTPEIEDTNVDAQSNEDATTEIKNDATEAISEVDQLKRDLEAEKDKFLRLFAEFENYKRRTTKERLELFKTAGQEVIQSLLPVIDDFDRAMAEIEKAKDKELAIGVGLISNKLKETLKSKGLEETQVKVGDSFDAELHEAITQIPAPNKKMVGKIVDVVEKGYALGDKIIRFPKVVTGK